MAYNPYQPPQSVGTSRELLRPAASSTAPLIAFLLAAIAYHGFILLLLSSSSGDRFAGGLFAINTPGMLVWGLLIWRERRHWLIGGILVCVVQCMIAVVMLIFGVGSRNTILSFLAIALSAYTIVLLVCWWNAKRIASVSHPEV